jgi:hypothetical protein
LTGDDGVIEALGFDSQLDEAIVVADMVGWWLDEGTPPNETAILVRQMPHLVAAKLSPIAGSRFANSRPVRTWVPNRLPHSCSTSCA